MNEYLIDTNYILRFILDDIPEQTKIVREYFTQAKLGQIRITVPYLAIIELDFNLSKLYKFSKREIAEKLFNFISIPFLEFEKREEILKALTLYPKVNLDLVDILLYCEAKLSGKELLTFDRKLKKLNAK